MHPELVSTRGSEFALLLDQIGSEVFVGEVGLDGSSAHKANLSDQIRIFTSIVRRCHSSGGRIVSIHSRGSVKQILDILEENRSVGYPVFHWFTGTPQQALRVVKLGGYFSVNDPAVLSRSGGQWIGAVPKSRILTETDGPFCEIGSRALWPGETSGAVSALGEVWNMPYDETLAQIRENALRLLAGVDDAAAQVSGKYDLYGFKRRAGIISFSLAAEKQAEQPLSQGQRHAADFLNAKNRPVF